MGEKVGLREMGNYFSSDSVNVGIKQRIRVLYCEFQLLKVV